MMHQAITETLAYIPSQKGPRQILDCNSQSPIPYSKLPEATFQVSEHGVLETVKDISVRQDIGPTHASLKKASAPNPLKEYGMKESMAINARDEPVMTPLEKRKLYTPLDTSFLNATLPSDNKLAQNVSPIPATLSKPSN